VLPKPGVTKDGIGQLATAQLPQAQRAARLRAMNAAAAVQVVTMGPCGHSVAADPPLVVVVAQGVLCCRHRAYPMVPR
jgi:hypothetical protein